jgi:hypothetical protein
MFGSGTFYCFKLYSGCIAVPERSAPDTLGPDGLVQPGVNPHVLCSHLLLSKLLDLLR